VPTFLQEIPGGDPYLREERETDEIPAKGLFSMYLLICYLEVALAWPTW
jgi:hypothetical protein